MVVLGRHKREFRVDLMPIAITEFAHQFFTLKKRHREALWSTVDHWINLSCRPIEELEKQITKQANIISIYHDRIKELEKQLSFQQVKITDYGKTNKENGGKVD